MTTALDVIIFDKGGVLTRSTFGRMKQDFSSTLGLSLDLVDACFEKHYPDLERGAISEDNFLRAMCDPPPGANDLFSTAYAHGETRIEHTLAIIEDLRARGIRVGLLSNTIPSHARINEQTGLYDRFDPLLLSCRLGARKPEARIWRMLIDACGVQPDRIGFVDDRAEMVASANAFGLRAAHYTGTESLEAALREWGL